MKKLGCLLLLLLSNFIIAQIKYEKGYLIDNLGQKTEGLIKNEDWMNNPTKFLFKGNESDIEITKSTQNVKEFGIDNFSKYERVEVLIDTSSVDWRSLSYNKNPEWSKKVIFLKVIVDGDAKLYEFADGINKKFFYSFKGSAVEQLVYKEYTEPNSTTVIENNAFRQQLWNNVKCTETKKETISRIKYKTSELIKYFTTINNCDGNKLVEKTVETKSTKAGFRIPDFSIRVKAGVNFSNLVLDSKYDSTLYPFEFGNKSNLKIGTEFQLVLGFNRNKWAVFYEPTYQKYKTERENINKSTTYKGIVDYSYLDHLIGLKYFMFLNKESKIFISGGLLYRQTIGDPFMYVSTNNHISFGYKQSSYMSFAGGLGFSYKKADVELRYSKSDIMGDNTYVSGKFGVVSVIFGYKIFGSRKNKI